MDSNLANFLIIFNYCNNIIITNSGFTFHHNGSCYNEKISTYICFYYILVIYFNIWLFFLDLFDFNAKGILITVIFYTSTPNFLLLNE